MGPPLRSFAADAHDCIMVRVLGPAEYKVVARLNRARKRAPLWSSSRPHQTVPSCSKPSRCGLARLKYAARLVQRPTLTASARAGVSETTVGTKKQTFKSNKETDEEKRWTALLKLLD